MVALMQITMDSVPVASHKQARLAVHSITKPLWESSLLLLPGAVNRPLDITPILMTFVTYFPDDWHFIAIFL